MVQIFIDLIGSLVLSTFFLVFYSAFNKFPLIDVDLVLVRGTSAIVSFLLFDFVLPT